MSIYGFAYEIRICAFAYKAMIYASAYRRSRGGAALPGGLAGETRERPGDGGLSFHRILECEGAAEMRGGAAVTVSGQPVQGGLSFRASPQVLLDAALYGRRTDAQRFLLIGAVAGAIRPDAEIGDFVRFVV
jgi:hypothetical protein